jgi:hypothetical protein
MSTFEFPRCLGRRKWHMMITRRIDSRTLRPLLRRWKLEIHREVVMEQIIGFIFLMFALIGVFAVLAAVINRPATRTWWREVLDVMAMNFGQARNRDE